ncbi:CBS-domain-containing protein [Trichocladium antarcticum]|uniref:CBS-domain-containing protein n=1 Tax=Trichocladium antarcticum TaxID=1450529 RepID=A0AAN6ZFT3_9PEZI|nr:CBS-domain-containing protein [Trichocladium antarcticum]
MDDFRAPPEKAHPSSSSAPAAMTPTTVEGGNNGTAQLPLRTGHEYPFVAPSSYLRPKPVSRTMSEKTPNALDWEQMQGLRGIREFLKVRTSYDVLPLSFRLVVLDNDLLIRKSLNILLQNGIVSAPLWDSHNSAFAGLLTSTDFINVIQYYCQYPDEIAHIDQFRLSSLRDIERAIGVLPLETVSVPPMRPLYEACRRMLKTRARRIPLIDADDETGREMVVSVITQYRILKFIAVNNEKYTMLLKKSVREIGLGTYNNLATSTMNNSVLDVIHQMVKHNISAVPIVDRGNKLLNVFEAVDVIPCIKGGAYDELASSVGDALSRRAEDFPGIYTCFEDDRLDAIFDTIRKSRVHRLIVVDDDSRLKGIISLSDILKYVLLFGEEDDNIRGG